MISLSNSHFLLGSLSSYYATNLKLCQSRTSAVRQSQPPSKAQGATCKPVPSLRAARCGVRLQGTAVSVFGEACSEGNKGALTDPKGFQVD